MFRKMYQTRNGKLAVYLVCAAIVAMLIGAFAIGPKLGWISVANASAPLAATSLAATVNQDTDGNQGDQTTDESASTQANQQEKQAEEQDENVTSVQSGVESDVRDEATKRREKLVQEAVDAVAETRKALDALDNEKNDEALSALERVVGKLELLVARDPALGLVPISQGVVIRDLWATVDTVKEEVEAAKELLNDGNVQIARRVLADLASETTISVTHLPLATYPEAIKAISPLIDDGKIAEAKMALQAALNTLVITNYTIPLPVVRAQALLNEAEGLTENATRSDDQSGDLESLLDSARKQLELAQVLGYGKQDDYQPMYDEIASIEKNTEDGKSGKGFFDKVNESLSNFRKSLFGG